jgi:hypothetical protein
VHIITYTCEFCGAERSCKAGVESDGMCASCGSPMRIENLFDDRRIIALPVRWERRALAGGGHA